MARKDHLAVDLVGDDREAAAQADLGQPLELVAPENPAHGIVRAAEEEKARALADRGRERVTVDLVAPVAATRERHVLAGEAHVAGGAQDRRGNPAPGAPRAGRRA